MIKDKVRQLLNLCFAIALPVVALVTQLGIGGPTVGAVSDRYPTYVVPAGYAFSIWNLIFALSLGYTIYQLRPSQRENPLLRQVGWFSASALLAASIWMLVFRNALFGLSVLVMIWLLISLIGAVAQTYRHRQVTPLSRAEWWLVHLTFSIFLGWITVATLANIAQTLSAWGWEGWGLDAVAWGILILLAGGVIASAVTAATGGNIPYALTVVWALVAVAVNQFSAALPTSSPTVGLAAASLAFLVGAILLTSRTQHRA